MRHPWCSACRAAWVSGKAVADGPDIHDHGRGFVIHPVRAGPRCRCGVRAPGGGCHHSSFCKRADSRPSKWCYFLQIKHCLGHGGCAIWGCSLYHLTRESNGTKTRPCAGFCHSWPLWTGDSFPRKSAVKSAIMNRRIMGSCFSFPARQSIGSQRGRIIPGNGVPKAIRTAGLAKPQQGKC